MDSPDNFVSFADYLGLNDEAGKSMLDKTLSGYGGKTPEQIQQMSEQNWAAAGQVGKDGGVYDSTKQGVQQGLASYGEFLAGMSDPAKRQALMEKTYGKGNVSWLDSALAGSAGGGSLRQAQTGLNQLRTSTGMQQMRNDGQRSDATKLRDDYAAQAADAKQRRDARAAADEKEKQAKLWLGKGFGAAANHVGGGRDAWGNEVSGWASAEAAWQDRAHRQIAGDPNYKAGRDQRLLGWDFHRDLDGQGARNFDDYKSWDSAWNRYQGAGAKK